MNGKGFPFLIAKVHSSCGLLGVGLRASVFTGALARKSSRRFFGQICGFSGRWDMLRSTPSDPTIIQPLSLIVPGPMSRGKASQRLSIAFGKSRQVQLAIRFVPWYQSNSPQHNVFRVSRKFHFHHCAVGPGNVG